MTAPWLSLIGIGEDGSLSPVAQQLLTSAKVVYGSARHFALAQLEGPQQREWPSPFSAVYEELRSLSGSPVAILATGDPQWFGIGSTLARHFAAAEMQILPAPSAFQLASARMKWPLQDVETLSIHGRPIEIIHGFLYPGARILALTSNGETPGQVARLLTDRGFGGSRLTVMEHMGGASERTISGLAENWTEPCSDFNTLAIEVAAKAETPFFARVPGLPDEAFVHDGKMTKREIRSSTISALMPFPGALLWDIGTGCGSVAIEWMRSARGARAIGLDPDASRRSMAAANASSLGVPGLELRDAEAPDGLSDLPSPDAIFIGGGLTAPGTVERCLAALKPGGRLVANAVTLESEAILLELYNTHGGDLVRLSVQRASPVGSLTGWRPLMPVTQWSFVKKGPEAP